MKYLYSLLILFVSISCCACGVDSDRKAASKSKELSYREEIAPIPPSTEYTLEETASQTADFRNYVVNAYQEVKLLASDDTSYEKGKELARELETLYDKRIAELTELDFTKMTKEELDEYMLELTSLTTIIREAKDALTLE